MDEPTWAARLRASTEVLIQKLSAELPKNAGAVAIERVLTQLEPDHLHGIAQVLINAATEEKKVILRVSQFCAHGVKPRS